MELPFKVLAIYSKEMDEKHKPKTIAEYLIHYYGNYQYASYYLNEEDFGNHVDEDDELDEDDEDYDETFHCSSSRSRSYSDMYSLVYTYFKRFFNYEVSFEEFMFNITWLYKRNYLYLYNKKELPYRSSISGFYCRDVCKFITFNGNGQLYTNIKNYSLLKSIYEYDKPCYTPNDRSNSNTYIRRDNPILANLHYFSRYGSMSDEDIKNIKTREDAYKWDSTGKESKRRHYLKRDNVEVKLLNDAHDSYYNEKNYKVIATYGSLKLGFHNHILLQQSGVINLGEFNLNIPYKMVDLGQFPGLLKDTKNNIIPMELYVVPIEVYKSIERLEGYPDFYDKQTVNYNDNVGVCELMVKDIEFYVLNEENDDYSKCDLVKDNIWTKIIK